MSLDKLRKGLQKELGKDAVKSGDDVEYVPKLCSFGSLSLDSVIGIMGIPKGRILEYFGPPSGGKTTLAIMSAVEVQKTHFERVIKKKDDKGKVKKEQRNSMGVVAFIDLENSFDRKWFENYGGSVEDEKFLYIKPDTGEEAFSALEQILESGEVDLVIVDSVATMLTEAESEGDFSVGQHMAQLARLMSQGLKKINSSMIGNPHCSVIFINQTRSSMDKYKPDEGTGGNSLRFYSSIRLYVSRVGGDDGIIGDKEAPEGFKTRIKVRKNKVGPPARTVEISLYIGPNKYGVDKDEEVVEIALSMGLIERKKKDKETDELYVDPKGTYYCIKDEVFYGRPKLYKYIEENPKIIEELKILVTTFEKNVSEPEENSFDSEVKKEEKKTTTKRKARKEKEDSEA
jgi:recombination protein RecA